MEPKTVNSGFQPNKSQHNSIFAFELLVIVTYVVGVPFSTMFLWAGQVFVWQGLKPGQPWSDRHLMFLDMNEIKARVKNWPAERCLDSFKECTCLQINIRPLKKLPQSSIYSTKCCFLIFLWCIVFFFSIFSEGRPKYISRIHTGCVD